MQCELCQKIVAVYKFGNKEICHFCNDRMEQIREEVGIGCRYSQGQAEMSIRRDMDDSVKEASICAMMGILKRIYGDKTHDRIKMFLGIDRLTKSALCDDHANYKALTDLYDMSKQYVWELRQSGNFKLKEQYE